MADSDIKIRFAVEGDQTLKSALKAIDSEIKALNDGFKASTEALKGMDSQEGTSATKAQQLQSVIEANKQKLSLLSTEYEKAKSKLSELSQELEKAKQSGDSAAIEKATIAYNNQSSAVSNLESQMSRTETAISSAKNEMDGLGEATEDASEKTDGASDAFKSFYDVLENIGTTVISKCVDGLKSFASYAVEVGTSFDSSMAKVKSISGATAEEFEQLSDKAEEMGMKTKFTATEAADAMTYMSMAGWKTEDMLGGIEGIMNLAAASGEDLASTSDIVTDALTAFGKSASDAGTLADILAAASANSNTNVGLMGESFKYVAPLAGTFKFTMQDTALALGVMANSGIKATQAGTSLRGLLSNLAAPTKSVQGAMNQLGISLTNSDGSMKSLREIIIELREKMSGLSEAEQAAIAKNLAGKNAMSGFLALINASDEDFEKLATSIDNSSGAAENMANTMNDTLPGAITILESAVSAVAKQVYDAFSGVAKDAIVQLTDYVQKLAEAFKTWSASDEAKAMMETLAAAVQRNVDLIGNNLEGIITGIISAFQAFGNAASFVIQNFDSICTVIGMAVSAFIAIKTAMAAINFITLISNPVGAVIVAITALIAIIVLCVQHWDDIKKGAKLCWDEICQKWQGAKEWFYEHVVKGIVDAFSHFVEWITSPFVNAWNAVVAAWNGAVQWFTDLANGIVKTITDAITTLPGKALNWAKDMMEGFGNGITQFMSKVTEPISNLAETISSFLHFSRPDIGPLRDYEKWMPDMISGMASSLKASIPVMESAAEGVAGAISGKLSNVTASSTVGLMTSSSSSGIAESIVRAMKNNGVSGGLTVNQTVNANQTSYAAQQREAATQLGMMARSLGYGV